MAGLLNWLSSWLQSSIVEADDESISEFNVAVGHSVVNSRVELKKAINDKLSECIIKLHDHESIEQTVVRFNESIMFTAGDLEATRQRLVNLQSLQAITVQDNELESHWLDHDEMKSSEKISHIVDQMLSVSRSFVKLDVLDPGMQKALHLILDQLKQSLIDKLLAELHDAVSSQAAVPRYERICLRVPMLNTTCILMIKVHDTKQPMVHLSFLSARVTLGDQYGSEGDYRNLTQSLTQIPTASSTLSNWDVRASVSA